MVLQRPSHNLGTGSRLPIDEHGHRRAVEKVALLGFETQFVARNPAFGIDDQSAVEKGVGHIHRDPEHPAGVVPQVHHETAEALRFRPEVSQGLCEVILRGVLKPADVDIAIARPQGPRPHAVGGDHRPHKLEVDRFLFAGPSHPQMHSGAGPATHRGDDVAQGAALETGMVQLDHAIAGGNAGACRRCVGDRSDHREVAIVKCDFDADAAEPTGGVLMQVTEAIFIQEHRMAIEPPQHPGDGIVHQLLARYVGDVVAVHMIHHRQQQPVL